MHRMHANRVSNNGTSASLNDDSIQRIKDGVKKSTKKRTAKKSKKAAHKKTAKKVEPEAPMQIKVANLSEIPEDFEQIGTGFYRKSHHLWELAPGEDGFVLTRKRGDDHILGYEPSPIQKQSSVINVFDRNGNPLGKGAKVKFPHHGKIATGTIIMLSPGSLGLDMGEMGEVDAPPDMVELDMSEPDDMGDSDKEAGDAFEPEISKKPKSDYVGPQTSQVGGIGGVGVGAEAEEEEPEQHTAHTAQTDTPNQTTTMAPTSPAEGGMEPYEPIGGGLAQKLDNAGVAIIRAGNGQTYYARKVAEDQYEAYLAETKMERIQGVETRADIAGFEQNIGGFEVIGHNKHVAKVVEAALNNQVDMKVWNEYWRQVGQRVAQKAPKLPDAGPSSMPGAQTGMPKSTEPRPPLTEEQKQQRKERRKERKTERAGLPPGAKLPPKPREAAVGADDMAKVKEHLRLYEQLVDELKYILQDESLREDEVRLADEVDMTLQNFDEEMEDMSREDEMDMEDSLSLDTPSEAEKLDRAASKTVVSMADL